MLESDFHLYFKYFLINSRLIWLIIKKGYKVENDNKKAEHENYIRTYIKNRYIEFFKHLLLKYEPNEILPLESVTDLVKYKFGKSQFDIHNIRSRMIAKEEPDNKKIGMWQRTEHLKEVASNYNSNLQKGIKSIEDYHTKIGTPLHGILFHIYLYLVYDITAASDSYTFADILSFSYTNNQDIRAKAIERVPYRGSRKTSRITNNKIKSSWMEKTKKSGMILEKRKPTLHWMPKSLRPQPGDFDYGK